LQSAAVHLVGFADAPEHQQSVQQLLVLAGRQAGQQNRWNFPPLVGLHVGVVIAD